MGKFKSRNSGKLRTDIVNDAVSLFILKGGRPLELAIITNYFQRKSVKEEIRREYKIDFPTRREFLVSSIEREDSGLMTTFDGSTKLVTLAKWGWESGRKPLLLSELREMEKSVTKRRWPRMRPNVVQISDHRRRKRAS
jgi:hypothetical protein